MTSSSLLGARTSPSLAAPHLAVEGLAGLDARIAHASPGFVLVHTTSPSASLAVAEYVARRARSGGVVAVSARPRAGAPLWHEVALALAPLGPSGPTEDPGAAVDHLLAAAHGRGVVVVAPLPDVASWDRSVAVELASRAHGFLVVFVTDERRGLAAASDGPSAARAFGAAETLRAVEIEVPAALPQGDREVWWSVLAEEAAADVSLTELAALESWWGRARRVALAGPEGAVAIEGDEAVLVAALAAVARPWRRPDVRLFDVTDAVVGPLLARGVVRESAGWLTLDPAHESRHAAGSGARAAALLGLAGAALSVVGSRGVGDAWALARAAELHVAAGQLDAADKAIEQALAQVEDSLARAEMVDRWTAAVDACPADQRLALQCRGAARALAVGEAEEAHRWARAASAIAPDDVSVTLLLGRALVALGDLVAAEVTLRHGAEQLARQLGDTSLAALVAAELAEVAYLKGDLAAAAREAEDALAKAKAACLAPASGRAPGGAQHAREATGKARNALGKILLAQSKWDEADRHFAEDVLHASAGGDVLGELRARLNRGIVFLSTGALDEARTIFESVRAEGERLGDFRAVAFALDNLAVVATWRHEYADALALSERTLKLRRRLGDRLTTARIVGNLAELRRKLGLLDHAEHSIAFGRRALGPGMPPERSAHFSFVAARIALDRGQTEAASREVARAIRDGELAGNKKVLAEAHRVSARIALEDGDLLRARASLTAARDLSSTDEARAEVAMLDALLARASGDDAEPLAHEALQLARLVGEEELLIESHALLCDTYRVRGELDAARGHFDQAVAVRDQVVAGLPPDVARAFLARSDVVSLGRLEAHLLDMRAAATSDAPSRPSQPELVAPAYGAGRDASQARVVVDLIGADPTMRALQATIKKVARSSATVLIRGESGTGKELVAAALHRASDRAAGPMVTVNCAALVETLLLSELFGHEKGAFTGATGRRRGRFELAEGGTLFLDEIGDISAKTQVALLRVLQERTFERVGGAAPIRVDVHVICATHRDLRAMVERGEFREDLYYRLRGITLDVPSLRSRLADLPALSDHLLGRIASERSEPKKALSPAALEVLGTHHWPGNVRELDNALRAASIFADGVTISAADLTENVDDLRVAAELVRQRSRRFTEEPPPPPSPRSEVTVLADEPANDADDDAAPLPVDEANATSVAYAQVRQGMLSLGDMKRQIERDCIARALAETKGNITRAAALLGMKRPRLSQLVKQYGLAAVTSEAT